MIQNAMKIVAAVIKWRSFSVSSQFYPVSRTHTEANYTRQTWALVDQIIWMFFESNVGHYTLPTPRTGKITVQFYQTLFFPSDQNSVTHSLPYTRFEYVAISQLRETRFDSYFYFRC